MRGTSHTPPPRGLSVCFRAVSLFPLIAILAFAAVFSGCASVSANDPSRIAAKISVVPAIVEFHGVVVGQQNTQTLRISNTSADYVRLETLHISGKGFSIASGQNPGVLAPRQSRQFTVAFKPSSTTSVAGAVEISSADPQGTLNVPLEGSGQKATPALAVSPNALNFGSLAVHSTSSQTVTLKNDGNVELSISSVGLPSAAFSVTGLSSGVSLSPGQTLPFRITFQPSATGASSSGVTINSSNLSSPVKLSLSGSGTSPTAATSTAPASTTPPSVKLSWGASASSVVGYHVYRGSTSGGPYARISTSTITALGYDDTTVQPGGRYYYVVSAVDSSGSESTYSNEAAADVPN